MSLYSTHTIRSDRVNFIHQTSHADGSDVSFNTSGNFNFLKPLLTDGIVLKNNYRIFIDEAEDTLFIQKKVGGVFTNYFSFKFS